MVRAVLFDLDGTLLDTRESILQSFEYTLEMHGVGGISRAAITRLISSGSLEDIYGLLIPGSDVVALSAMHRDWQTKNAHLYVPYAGSRKLLENLRDENIRIAAVSTRKHTVEASLRRANLFELFDVVITGNTIVNVKPHPEGLLTALEKLESSPAEAVMVGDTEADIGAGKNAGTKTIGLTWGFRSRSELTLYAPDELIDDIDELPVVISQLSY